MLLCLDDLCCEGEPALDLVCVVRLLNWRSRHPTASQDGEIELSLDLPRGKIPEQKQSLSSNFGIDSRCEIRTAPDLSIDLEMLIRDRVNVVDPSLQVLICSVRLSLLPTSNIDRDTELVLNSTSFFIAELCGSG